jgi:acetyl esterase/lipase
MKDFVKLLFVLLCGTAVLAEDSDSLRPDKRVVYKEVGGTKLELHLFLPPGHKAGDTRAAILFFFGGGWNGGTPSQFYGQCQHLAARGMVAISAEYRVASRHRTTPQECVMDGKSAIRWVRTQAKVLGVDPQRIAAGGGSAGGHVAAAAAMTDGFEEPGEPTGVSARPNALVLFNPVFDNAPGGYGHDRVKAYWKEFSPLHNITKSAPPTVIFLGTNDDLIPVKTAQEYKRLMEEKGNRCDLHLYEGQAHGFFNAKNKEYYAKTLKEADRFLVSLNYLQPQ